MLFWQIDTENSSKPMSFVLLPSNLMMKSIERGKLASVRKMKKNNNSRMATFNWLWRDLTIEASGVARLHPLCLKTFTRPSVVHWVRLEPLQVMFVRVCAGSENVQISMAYRCNERVLTACSAQTKLVFSIDHPKPFCVDEISMKPALVNVRRTKT